MNNILSDITEPFAEPTPDHGEVVTFPRGLLGFEDCHKFRLERTPAWEPFAKLVSIDQSRLTFIIAPPRLFAPDFFVRIDPLEVAELGIREVADVDLWAIVTVPDDPQQMSANLQGPIIINRVNCKGKQVVLTRSQYCTQHPMFAEETV